RYRLEARGAVHVSGSGNQLAHFGADAVSEGHKRRGVRFLKEVAGGFFDDGRSKGSKNFAMLDPAIEDLFHFGPARIGDDAAVAERSRSPLGCALKPADDFAGGNVARGGLRERRFIQFKDLAVT